MEQQLTDAEKCCQCKWVQSETPSLWAVREGPRRGAFYWQYTQSERSTFTRFKQPIRSRSHSSVAVCVICLFMNRFTGYVALLKMMGVIFRNVASKNRLRIETESNLNNMKHVFTFSDSLICEAVEKRQSMQSWSRRAASLPVSTIVQKSCSSVRAQQGALLR